MKLISLTQGKFAQVDDEDYEYLNQLKWCAAHSNRNWYAVRGLWISKKQTGTKSKVIIIQMHRLIMQELNNKKIIDHKDRDGLNNQKHNLRIATFSENMRNRRSTVSGTSKYLGVSFGKGAWQAQITLNKKVIYLGRFSNEKTAARKYNEVAKIYNGEFANLNEV